MKTSMFIAALLLLTSAMLDAQNPKELAFQTYPELNKVTFKDAPEKEARTAVRTQADYKGGSRAMGEFIQSRMLYPSLARTYGVEGQVIVQFTVNASGEIHKIKIVESLGYGCDEMARSIVQQMPKWNPAKFSGRSISSIVRIPIQFRLN